MKIYSSLNSFIQQDLLELDESDVFTFLSDYNSHEIAKAILNSFQEIDGVELFDDSWKMGDVLSSIEVLSIDKYLIHEISSIPSNRSNNGVVSFLSAYWNSVSPDLESLTLLADMIISRIDDLDFEVFVLAGIEAVAIAYANCSVNSFDENLLNRVDVLKRYLEKCKNSEHISKLFNKQIYE